MKGRTNEEGIDPVKDGNADETGWRGKSEGRHGGKHGAPQERTRIEEILEPENLARAWTATARKRTEMAKPSRRAGPQARINA